MAKMAKKLYRSRKIGFPAGFVSLPLSSKFLGHKKVFHFFI
jgi:hypothetical protein